MISTVSTAPLRGTSVGSGLDIGKVSLSGDDTVTRDSVEANEAPRHAQIGPTPVRVGSRTRRLRLASCLHCGPRRSSTKEVNPDSILWISFAPERDRSVQEVSPSDGRGKTAITFLFRVSAEN